MGDTRSAEGGAAGGGAGSRVFVGFLVFAVVALSVLCVLLARENRELKAMRVPRGSGVGGGLGGGVGVEVEPIRVGERLGGLTLVRRDGTVRELRFGEGEGGGGAGLPTLVLIMGAGCGYCEEAIPVWERVLTELGLGGEETGGWVRVAAVQTDAKDAAGLMALAPAVPVYMAPEARGTWLVRVHVEPSAILLDAGGMVVGAWMGMPAAVDADDLREALLAAGAGGDQ